MRKERKLEKNCFRYSQAGRRNPVLASNSEKKVDFNGRNAHDGSFRHFFATGLDDPLHNKHCFFRTFCKQNVKIASRGFSKLKRHFQREHH